MFIEGNCMCYNCREREGVKSHNTGGVSPCGVLKYANVHVQCMYILSMQRSVVCEQYILIHRCRHRSGLHLGGRGATFAHPR